MTLFLNLSRIRPLDILLTTEDGWSSRAIRAAQAVRFLKPTRFSHASLFLAPSVIVESDEPGTIVTNLAHAPVKGGIPRARNLSCRMVGRELAIFVELESKSGAQVVRPLAAANWHAGQVRSGRSAVMEALLPAYLARYSNAFHFLAASGAVPRSVQSYAEEKLAQLDHSIGNVLDPRTGTFCSELVSMLLAAAMVVSSREHSQTVPGHFEWQTDEFDPVKGVVIDGEANLPGTACPADLERKVAALLRTHLDRETTSKILGLAESRLINDPIKTLDLRIELSNQLGGELAWVDALWEWVDSVNHCAAVCPKGSSYDEHRRSRAAKVNAWRDGRFQPVGYPTVACDEASLPGSCLTYGHDLDQLYRDMLQSG